MKLEAIDKKEESISSLAGGVYNLFIPESTTMATLNSTTNFFKPRTASPVVAEVFNVFKTFGDTAMEIKSNCNGATPIT